LQQADLLTTNNSVSGFAIAECIQIVSSSLSSKDNTSSINDSLITQRIIKGRSKVMKSYKNWQFDKLPLTILQLITIKQSSVDNKFRSKVKKFLSTKTSTPNQPLSSSFSDSSLPCTLGIIKPTTPKLSHASSSPIPYQHQLNELNECSNILERQQRLLNYLDEKIHQTQYNVLSHEQLATVAASTKWQNDMSIDNSVHPQDVSLLFSNVHDKQQLYTTTQLCNQILRLQDRINEQSNILYDVERAISNELNSVLFYQQDNTYDTLPITLNSSAYGTITTTNSNNLNTNSETPSDVTTLKNSIYRSREVTRLQCKEMHDLDLCLRESDIVIGKKIDDLKYLEHETQSSHNNNNNNLHVRSMTPNYNCFYSNQSNTVDESQQQLNYNTISHDHLNNSIGLTIMDSHNLYSRDDSKITKEADDDSGINSLISDDSNMVNGHQTKPCLETLV
ncbi:unnamed protein product, partial [Didymodactylos carnosus]